MSSYIYSPNNSYSDYLQNKQYVDDISYELESNTRELIASNEQIAERHLDGIHDLSNALEGGFEGLSMQIGSLTDAIESGFHTLNETFRWGFAGIMLSIGHLSDTLKDLETLMENSSKVWAYEQYFDARQAFLNGWHRESYDLVQRAIEGHGSNTGYKLEYRFHFLLGQTLLGNNKNNDASVIDPASAEEAFLAATRYSETNFPKEAAIAYLCASRSAYVRGDGARALGYAKRALDLDRNLLEARFQRAKLFCHLGNWQNADPDFKDLFHKNALWAVKAADDGDVRKYKKELNDAISFVTRTINERVDRAKPWLVRALEEFDEAAASLHVLKIHKNLSVQEILADAEKERASDTLSGAQYAEKLLADAKKKYQEWVVQRIDDMLDHRVQELGVLASNARKEIEGHAAGLQKNREQYREALPGKYGKRLHTTFLRIGLVFGAILFIYGIITHSPFWDLVGVFFGSLLFAGFIALCASIAGGIIGWIRKILTPTKDRATRRALSDIKQHDKEREREKKLVEEDIKILRHLRNSV
ncbi:MAG: hypothetical protein Greene041614_1168 [Parcubacteria group bacterium Greene0416_14]|nr:MAG: hypothetical protein Greene041614_1168 [Parcubacteria group bacterium Greene0416_14]TSC99403.1 MAG: hypothetical protein Greene101415_1159 [Parcubacteria group bacterium Greene1014_15]TSD06639.1 MAG: hypothetical protein Greene07144_1140 [Parcubacteria group bacterium Greene0714_4]